MPIRDEKIVSQKLMMNGYFLEQSVLNDREIMMIKTLLFLK